VAEVVCPRCAHHNLLGSNFCSSCGLDISERPDDTATHPVIGDVHEPPAAVVSTVQGADEDGVLVVTRGPDVGSRIALGGGRLTAGRHPDSDLFLDDVTVSRRHAEIVHTAEGYEIVDVGSLNGTYVNRRRVERAVLQAGDEVQIGKFKLVFRSAGAPR